ncbi:MAG: phospholipase D-like domain-containing protein [Roseitalea porphyridii]|uniref:phospholipase D family protein n=1 Tax=Roseitalea porphyridii TaxID=1852022 RepID=UPI0032F03862
MAQNNESLRHFITAEEAFPEMEALVLSATEKLCCGLHIFSPRTKMRSRQAHRSGIVDWGGLLADALSRGVQIRILLNDFDPVGAPDMHASVWERIGLFGEALADLDASARGRLEMLVAHPGGQAGFVLRAAIWPKVRAMMHSTRRQFTEEGRPLPPGLRPDLPGDATIAWWPPRPNFTQTMHQKFLVADGWRAVLGGLDIDERRYDDPGHRRKADQTWHDVSVSFEGDPAADLQAHFDACWQAVRREGASHADAYRRQHPESPIKFAEPDPGSKGETGPPALPDRNGLRIAVTRPVMGRSPLRFGPRPRERSLERVHIDLIGSARRLLYLETQFFRSSIIRDALAGAMGENEGLHVIMLLPGAPDVVAYDGKKSAVHRYGEWLQMRALNRLSSQFPDRFSAFSLTNDRTRSEQHERDALHGKAMVYVHSKLAVADDRSAIVSSANLNARSMQWDLEAGIAIDDAGFAARLRRDLWRSHLGEAAMTLDPYDDPARALSLWREQAAEREAAGSAPAKAGVVPFPLERTRRFATRHLFLPEQLV